MGYLALLGLTWDQRRSPGVEGQSWAAPLRGLCTGRDGGRGGGGDLQEIGRFENQALRGCPQKAPGVAVWPEGRVQGSGPWTWSQDSLTALAVGQQRPSGWGALAGQVAGCSHTLSASAETLTPPPLQTDERAVVLQGLQGAFQAVSAAGPQRQKKRPGRWTVCLVTPRPRPPPRPRPLAHLSFAVEKWDLRSFLLSRPPGALMPWGRRRTSLRPLRTVLGLGARFSCTAAFEGTCLALHKLGG